MKPWVKWSLIGFVGLAMIGQIAESLKSPEEKAAEQAKKAADTALREAAREANSAAEKEQKAAAQQAKLEQAAREIEALPNYSAREIAADYEANTVAADQKYKDKMFKITGRVSDINTDFTGDPYITMGGTNSFMQPQFSFNKDSLGQLAKIKKGMTLTIACKGRGDVVKMPVSGDCQLL